MEKEEEKNGEKKWMGNDSFVRWRAEIKNCWVGISSFIFNSIENFAEFILCEFKADEVADKYESTKSF